MKVCLRLDSESLLLKELMKKKTYLNICFVMIDLEYFHRN